MADYFIYCRKSQEAEDRQVLSIESQMMDLKRLADTREIHVREILTEARSAKEPGRPIFTKMMERIARGEVKGLICWKLDRLARNPIDGGAVIWAIKNGLEIVTPTQTFRQTDDTAILSYIEFGMAQKYIDDLSRNVKRGLRTKAEKGWYPAPAPLGYLNLKNGANSISEIVPDPERFDLLRRMWDMKLTGTYSVAQIVAIANRDWGFRTRPMKKLGGQPVCVSAVHRMFTQSFYYGCFEYPCSSGNWYRGNHKPMVTEEEFDRVQVLLGRKDKPRPIKHTFALTGLIRCGECGGSVTAEEKHQLICGGCKTKFAYRNRELCPGCDAKIGEMPTPTFLRYEYYHCIKRRNPHCKQKVSHAGELERQILSSLDRLQISERTIKWVNASLSELRVRDQGNAQLIHRSTRSAYEACLKQLDNLLDLKTSDRNVAGNLLSDEEYETRRSKLLKEKARMEHQLASTPDAEQTVRRIQDAIATARYAAERFRKGDAATKRRIVMAIGSNLTLIDGKLNIDAKIPFRIISDTLPESDRNFEVFEPKKRPTVPMVSGRVAMENPAMLGWKDDVRTYKKKIDIMVRKLYRYFLEHPHEPVPTLDDPPERFPWQEAA